MLRIPSFRLRSEKLQSDRTKILFAVTAVKRYIPLSSIIDLFEIKLSSNFKT